MNLNYNKNFSLQIAFGTLVSSVLIKKIYVTSGVQSYKFIQKRLNRIKKLLFLNIVIKKIYII